jgi:hypothetical protein
VSANSTAVAAAVRTAKQSAFGESQYATVDAAYGAANDAAECSTFFQTLRTAVSAAVAAAN